MPENKIKILFLVNDLGVGGVQRLVVEFANFLDKEKFDVSVAILFSKPDSYFYKKELKNEVNFFNFSFKGFWDLPQWLKLYRFLRKNKFDIMFSQLFMADVIGRVLAFFAGVPVIITEIQNLAPAISKKYVYADKFLSFITTACISTTSAVTQYAVKTIGFPKKKVFEIPTNVVDKRKFESYFDKADFRKKLGIPLNAKVIINIGRLVTQKGQRILLEAIPEILAEAPYAYFLIVGDGSQKDQLKSQAKDLGIEEKVRFLGSRADTANLLRASDIFVFPSLWEGQGLILFEAIFSKIPIVASNVGGIPDVIEDGVTGVLVKADDAKDLTRGILKVLKNPETGVELVKEAFNKYQDRTVDNSVKKLEELFIKLLS